MLKTSWWRIKSLPANRKSTFSKLPHIRSKRHIIRQFNHRHRRSWRYAQPPISPSHIWILTSTCWKWTKRQILNWMRFIESGKKSQNEIKLKINANVANVTRPMWTRTHTRRHTLNFPRLHNRTDSCWLTDHLQRHSQYSINGVSSRAEGFVCCVARIRLVFMVKRSNCKYTMLAHEPLNKLAIRGALLT